MIDQKRNTILSILILMPSIILVGIFIYGFIGNTLVISFTDWGSRLGGLAENPEKNFIGFANYKQVFSDFVYGRFRQDLINAAFYSLFLMAGALALGFLFAVLLDREVKGEGFFRTLFLYPMALAFIVTGTIWRWLVAPSGGFNILPTFWGKEAVEFLWTSSRTKILTFNWQNIIQILFAVAAVVFAFLLIRGFYMKEKKHRIRNAVICGVSLVYVFILHRLLPLFFSLRNATATI